MMNLNLLSLILLSLSLSLVFNANSQCREPLFIIGVEAGGQLSSFSNTRLKTITGFEYGISLEKTLKNKFSIGTGISKTLKDNIVKVAYEDENIPTYKLKGYEIEGYSIPVRLIYRLECNCAFFHAGYISEFVQEKMVSSYTRDSSYTYGITEYNNLRNYISSIEVGVGYKNHFTESLRLILKVSYRKYFGTYYKNESPGLSKNFINLSIGLQKAIQG